MARIESLEICNECQDIIRTLNWIQPSNDMGVGGSVALVERVCQCTSDVVGVTPVTPGHMRIVEAAWRVEEAFQAFNI